MAGARGTDPAGQLKDALRRLTLLLGVAQITVGCLVGLVPPAAVPWFRGLVMAHVEYTGNGMLLVLLALLLPELRLGRTGLRSWFVALQCGTWLNGTAALLAGVVGRSSPLLSVASAASAPPRGTADTAVTTLLVAAAVCVLVGLALTLVGLGRAWPAGTGVGTDAAVVGALPAVPYGPPRGV